MTLNEILEEIEVEIGDLCSNFYCGKCQFCKITTENNYKTLSCQIIPILDKFKEGDQYADCRRSKEND